MISGIERGRKKYVGFKHQETRSCIPMIAVAMATEKDEEGRGYMELLYRVIFEPMGFKGIADGIMPTWTAWRRSGTKEKTFK